jgi:predicted 2-oxoglutarate/Fe(II)-dependent dioxygenase YbiX
MEYFHVGACTDPGDNAKFGIYLYRNAIPRDLNIPERLEATIGNSTHELFKWSDATVGYSVKKPDYRNCMNLKINPTHWQHLTSEFEEIKKCYEDIESRLKICLTHYESMYNFKMEYMEAINFVRYTPGQHFAVHTDHGFSYTCTLSSVMYLNDDYNGGEIWFPYLNIKFKPEAGDIIFFPSTFIYAHASEKVTSGTKYSAVTMFDYNDNNHKQPLGYASERTKITEDTGITRGPNQQPVYFSKGE